MNNPLVSVTVRAVVEPGVFPSQVEEEFDQTHVPPANDEYKKNFIETDELETGTAFASKTRP